MIMAFVSALLSRRTAFAGCNVGVMIAASLILASEQKIFTIKGGQDAVFFLEKLQGHAYKVMFIVGFLALKLFISAQFTLLYAYIPEA